MNNDIDSSELTEQEERPERQGRGLARIQTFTITQPGEKTKPREITTEHKRPSLPPPRKVRDSELIAAKKAELARLEFELLEDERARQSVENRLQGVLHEIDVRVRQLKVIAGECARVESKELPEQFLLLFRKSLYGGLDTHDLATFVRIGAMLSNKKLLLSMLQSEARPLDDELVFLEKEKEELRAKLGPDAETEAE
jgi:hypothetical protein